MESGRSSPSRNTPDKSYMFPSHQNQYFDLVDPETIRPIDVVEVLVQAALAVWIGKTRLIDNNLCDPARPNEPHKNHSEFADTQPKQLTTSLPGCRQSGQPIKAKRADP